MKFVKTPRIAQQIALAFGVDIDKDEVRRILGKYYGLEPGSGGPSWLTFLGQAKDSEHRPVHGEFIKSRGNRRLVEWSILDLLECNHVCGLSGLSRKKDAKPEVTRRYTVHI